MKTMNKKLGENSKREICKEMEGLTGSPAKAKAVRLAQEHDVTWQRIYEITAHLRPKQKTRSDKGTTKWDLKEGSQLWLAFQLVVAEKPGLDPDQALETAEARIRERGEIPNLPTLATFQNLLRKYGFSRSQRKNKRVSYRRWESEYPGEIIQFDNSSLKEGFWFDVKTRKVLRIAETEVNKNHPNKNPNHVRVWQQCAVDDCSRRTYLRYLVKDHLTSRDQLEFELLVYAEFGLPLKKYSDNGGEMRGRIAEAEILLNSITANVGGFEHLRHLPHNSKATGKVEVRHQFAQKMEKFIALALSEGDTVTKEKLDRFAANINTVYNEKNVNRTTGQTPMARWWSRKIVARQIPVEVLRSALLSDIFESILAGDCTVSHNGKIYQLPRVRPFVNYTTSKEKLKIIVPENIEVLLVQLPCDRADEWREITKVLATADNAGEFKQTAESDAEQLRKRLKATRDADRKAIKEKRKQTGEGEAIPNWNRDVIIPLDNSVLNFPQRTSEVTASDVERVVPVPSVLTEEPDITFWDAIRRFETEFADANECREFMLQLFGSRDAALPVSTIETVVENREFIERRKLLKAV